MANPGDKHERFTLSFWYYDGTGKKVWKSSQIVELGPHESKQLLVHVPFTSSGVFVFAEAHSFSGKDLVNATRLTVTVPWLTVNLYILMVIAAVILSASGIGIAHLLGKAGLLALIIPRKARPPRVLVTGKEKPQQMMIRIRRIVMT
jgi:hypothetical protein